MSPVPQERIDQMKNIIHEVIGTAAGKPFLARVDAILADWSADKLNASQTAEKIEKMVSLFIDGEKAKEISSRCAPIIMKSASFQK